MGAFQNKTFRASADAGKIGMKYRALMAKHPFLAFGLPFIAVIVAGSFVLTPATAIRYEKHDRRVRQMTKEEELNVRRGARKVDMKEEYYVSFSISLLFLSLFLFVPSPFFVSPCITACLSICLFMQGRERGVIEGRGKYVMQGETKR